MNERYNVYSTYLKERYGEKVYKLPISIPDTCPNRDGTLAREAAPSAAPSARGTMKACRLT